MARDPTFGPRAHAPDYFCLIIWVLGATGRVPIDKKANATRRGFKIPDVQGFRWQLWSTGFQEEVNDLADRIG